MLACSPQSNPNLPTPASRGSGVLARSSSHPPDAICWNPPARLIDSATQTDWPCDLFEVWVRANPERVLRALHLDPDLVLRLPPPSPTPSPSSPPPPPYEPLSPLVGTPRQSPSRSLTTGNYTSRRVRYVLGKDLSSRGCGGGRGRPVRTEFNSRSSGSETLLVRVYQTWRLDARRKKSLFNPSQLFARVANLHT